MANNPRLSKISVELAMRMNDAKTLADAAITTGDQDGTVYTAAARMMAINKAMFKLVDDVWMMANQQDYKNAKIIFAGVFPELVVKRDVATGVSTGQPNASEYSIITPNLDYFQLLEAAVNNGSNVVQAELLPSYLYQTIKWGRTIQIKGTLSIPTASEIGGVIYLFESGGTGFPNRVLYLTFLRQPLDKTQGCFLSMTNGSSGGNTEDSPFLDQHNSKIAELAENILRYEGKE